MANCDGTSAPLALVIGGCTGIGRAVSARLAADGFDIVATSRKQSAASDETEAQVTAAGRQFKLLEFDVCDREKARQVLGETFAQQTPDVVVYNAGIAQDNLFVFMENSQWDQVMDTNLNGFFNTVQPLVFNMLAQRRGRIIVISSASGQTGQAGQVNYSATKAGLIGSVKALAREVGRKGILVNAVAPGLIATDMIKDLPVNEMVKLIPLHRPGEVEEVAGVVSFLAGKDASYITGQVIAVNGGLVI